MPPDYVGNEIVVRFMRCLHGKVTAAYFTALLIPTLSACNMFTHSGGGASAIAFPTPGPGMIRILSGHWLWVDVVAWSPDSKLLASGASDHTASVWEVASGKSIATMDFPTT